MKMQIKKPLRVIFGITLLIMLLLAAAFKTKEDLEQVQDTQVLQTMAKLPRIDIHIIVMIDKVEAIKQFIVGWQGAWE